MSEFKSINPLEISLPELHSYLLGAVAPRPIAFASTVDKEGRVNLSPFSFFNAFSSNPPILIFSPSRSGRTNTSKHTLDNVKDVAEVTINVVNHAIVEQVSLTSTEYERGVNEFIKAGLTQVKSSVVKPPWVGESPVAFECYVQEVVSLGEKGGSGNLVICEVKLIHVNEKYLDVDGKLNTPRLDLVGRMGGSWYCRAGGDALFEIPKPITKKGIGIDQLPKSIVESKILTGNDLARLGNLERIPTRSQVKKMAQIELIKKLMQNPEDQANAHQIIKSWLEDGQNEDALALAFYAHEYLRGDA